MGRSQHVWWHTHDTSGRAQQQCSFMDTTAAQSRQRQVEDAEGDDGAKRPHHPQAQQGEPLQANRSGLQTLQRLLSGVAAGTETARPSCRCGSGTCWLNSSMRPCASPAKRSIRGSQ